MILTEDKVRYANANAIDSTLYSGSDSENEVSLMNINQSINWNIFSINKTAYEINTILYIYVHMRNANKK